MPVTIGDLCMQQEAASIGSSNSDLPLERGFAATFALAGLTTPSPN